MRHILIGYDLNEPKRDYKKLWAALEGIGAERILASQWLLISEKTPQEILRSIQDAIDEDDSLLVAEMSDWAGIRVNAGKPKHKVAS